MFLRTIMVFVCDRVHTVATMSSIAEITSHEGP